MSPTRLTMNKYPLVLLLAALALFNCAFDWGFSPDDKCYEAKKLVIGFAALQDDIARAQAEGRVLGLCPNGAAGQLVKGMELEKKGNLDGAIGAYQKALHLDPAFLEADGS